MIDEITALMPILEKISDGALWAFAIFMLVKIVSVVVWPICLVFLAVKVLPAMLRAIMGDVRAPEVDLYRLEYKGERLDHHYIGGYSELAEFMTWVANGRTYIHGHDLKKIIEGKRQ